MGTGIFSIGVSGITAAQTALLTTEHNITNANTAGYTRQRTIQATNVPIMTGAGAIGQGVHVETVERVYDRFLTSQINQAQTIVSEQDTFYTQIRQIDNMLADANAGLSPALQSFFSGIQEVAAGPSSIPARQTMVTSAETMAQRFQSLDARLSEFSEQVNGRIVDAISKINTFSSQIAEINQRIVAAEGSFGQPPNDLLDQRDQLVAELNQLVKVSTSTNADGSFNVFMGNGQQLVVGGIAMSMTATAASADPTMIAVGLETAGTTQELPESIITGGELGGLLRFRSEALQPAINELGLVAASLALTFNAQHSLGQDLNNSIDGDAGFVGDFFALSDPRVVPNSSNTGAGAMTATFAAPDAPASPDYSGNFSTDLVASDYQIQFGAAGAYSVLRLSDNQVVASGAGAGTVSFDGVDLDITAVGASGDKFLLQPFHDTAKNLEVDSRIAADVRLVAAAAPVRATPNVSNQGNLTLSQGVVGVGYSAPAAGTPVTLTATATQLTGFPGAGTAVYTDGSTLAFAAGAANLTNGAATLARITFDGMSFEVNGSPAAGDTFSIERNTNGFLDGRNAVLLGQLQTQKTTLGGTATYQATYAQLVADNGIRTNEAHTVRDAQQALLDQSKARREEMSGVNLDEEAANLIRFQQAYQASAKLLEVGNTLFDTILSIAS